MSSWLNDVISGGLIAVYEGHYFTEDALLWLREKPRTFGELRTEEIDWLRWMAANIEDEEVLENLSQDPDTDVRMWVACNPVTLEKLAEDLSFSSARNCPKQQHPCTSSDKAERRPRHSNPSVSLQERSSIEMKLLR